MNTVHANDKTLIASTTLEEVHGVTPIFPEDPSAEAIRDVLVIGYNATPALQRPA